MSIVMCLYQMKMSLMCHVPDVLLTVLCTWTLCCVMDITMCHRRCDVSFSDHCLKVSLMCHVTDVSLTLRCHWHCDVSFSRFLRENFANVSCRWRVVDIKTSWTLWCIFFQIPTWKFHWCVMSLTCRHYDVVMCFFQIPPWRFPDVSCRWHIIDIMTLWCLFSRSLREGITDVSGEAHQEEEDVRAEEHLTSGLQRGSGLWRASGERGGHLPARQSRWLRQVNFPSFM